MIIAKKSGVDIEFSVTEVRSDLVVPIAKTSFQSLISNILSNAIEASAPGKRIRVQVTQLASKLSIVIQDDGKGMPEDVLSRIGKEEISFGKKSGNGLGLFSASNIIKACGGRLNIFSKLDVGTEVQITLPCHEVASALLARVDISAGAMIVVIDDDKAVHEVWRHRLSALSTEQTILVSNIMTAEQFVVWSDSPERDNSQKYYYFVDYDFHSSNNNGLDLIQKFKLQEQAVLVTAHYTEPEVIDRAKALSVSVLPKHQLANVPMAIV